LEDETSRTSGVPPGPFQEGPPLDGNTTEKNAPHATVGRGNVEPTKQESPSSANRRPCRKTSWVPCLTRKGTERPALGKETEEHHLPWPENFGGFFSRKSRVLKGGWRMDRPKIRLKRVGNGKILGPERFFNACLPLDDAPVQHPTGQPPEHRKLFSITTAPGHEQSSFPLSFLLLLPKMAIPRTHPPPTRQPVGFRGGPFSKKGSAR